MNNSSNNRTFVIIGLLICGIIFGIGPFKNANCKSDKPNYIKYDSPSSNQSQPSFTGNSSKSSLERDYRSAEGNRDYYLKEARTASENGDYYLKEGKPDIAESYYRTAKAHSERAASYERNLSEIRQKINNSD